jgi:hypothetical protein
MRHADAALPAVEAYYAGWASTGATVDGRTFLGAAAALLTEGAPTHQLGHLDGTWAVIHDRREDVHRRNQREVHAAARPVLATLDVTALADDVWAMAHRVGESVDPELQADIDARVSAGVAELPGSPGWQELRDAVAIAGQHGTAEGVTDALGALADGLGRGIDWDLAFTDAWDAMSRADLIGPADEWLAQMVSGLSTDLGRALAGAMTDGATYEQLVAAAQSVLGADRVASVRYTVDVLTGRSLTDGMLSVYQRVGAREVDFITAGDQRVCNFCASYEAESPYGLTEALPPCPAHGFCRCIFQALDYPDPSAVVGPYLIDDAEEA